MTKPRETLHNNFTLASTIIILSLCWNSIWDDLKSTFLKTFYWLRHIYPFNSLISQACSNLNSCKCKILHSSTHLFVFHRVFALSKKVLHVGHCPHSSRLWLTIIYSSSTYFSSKSMKRQHGWVVMAVDLKSEDPKFKSHSDHNWICFRWSLVQLLGCKLRDLGQPAFCQ